MGLSMRTRGPADCGAALQIGGRGSVTCPDCTRHHQVIGSRVDDRGEQAGAPVGVEERATAR